MNQQELNEKLNEIKDKVSKIDQAKDNRIYIHCQAEDSYDVNKFLFEEVGARFVIASGIDNDDNFEVIYHFSYDQTGCMINIKAFINDRENPSAPSITPFLPGAEWIEREMHDLLGIKFDGHPNLTRLILADDWPEGVYPLRKEVKK